MPPRNKVKADALARIERGPAFVRLDPDSALYHVGVIGLGEYEDGVWLVLNPDEKYAVRDYAAAELRLNGQAHHLSRRTADYFARIVARTMRRRSAPVVWPRIRRKPRRRQAPARSVKRGGAKAKPRVAI